MKEAVLRVAPDLAKGIPEHAPGIPVPCHGLLFPKGGVCATALNDHRKSKYRITGKLPQKLLVNMSAAAAAAAAEGQAEPTATASGVE